MCFILVQWHWIYNHLIPHSFLQTIWPIWCIHNLKCSAYVYFLLIYNLKHRKKWNIINWTYWNHFRDFWRSQYWYRLSNNLTSIWDEPIKIAKWRNKCKSNTPKLMIWCKNTIEPTIRRHDCTQGRTMRNGCKSTPTAHRVLKEAPRCKKTKHAGCHCQCS